MSRYTYIFIGILVGIMSILPYLLAYTNIETDSGGQKLSYFYQDSELLYLSRIREVTEGNIHISSPVFFEYKNATNIQQPFGEWLYAAAAAGNSEYIPSVAIVSKFLLPLFLFIILYLLSLKILQNFGLRSKTAHIVGLFISTLIVLGNSFVNVGFLQDVFSNSFSSPSLSIWTRTVHPITGAIGLFGVSYLMFTFGKKLNAIRVVSAGIILAFLAGYVFSYAIGMMIFGIMLVFSLLERNWGRVKNLFYVLMISIIINGSYLLSLLTYTDDVDSLRKNGLLLTHNVLHNKVLYIAGALFVITSIYLYYIKKDPPIWKNISWQFLAAGLLAGLVSLNQQVITGKTVWPGHFVQYTNPIGYIVFFISLYVLVDTIARHQSSFVRKWIDQITIAGSILGIILIFALNLSAVQSYTSNIDEYKDIQRYSPTLEWFRTNGGKICVVFVAEEYVRLEKYVTAYTQCDLYHSSYVFYGVPSDRVMHNYILHLRLLGVSGDTLPEYLDTHENDMREYFFEDWADKFSDGRDQWVFNTRVPGSMENFLPNAKNSVINAYNEVASKSITELLKKFEITYIVFDTKYDLPDSTIYDYDVVFEQDGLVVFEIE